MLGLLQPSWSALIARWGGCRHAPAPLRCARALRIRHPTLRFGGEEVDRSEGPVGRIGVGYTVYMCIYVELYVEVYVIRYVVHVRIYTNSYIVSI